MYVEDIKLDIRTWDSEILDRFPNKDLITMEELIRDYVEALNKIKHLQNEYNELERDLKNNYTKIETDPYEEYGVSESDFI